MSLTDASFLKSHAYHSIHHCLPYVIHLHSKLPPVSVNSAINIQVTQA